MIEDFECSGEHNSWYYLYLLFVHVYFLIEFLLKLYSQKYRQKFLQTFDSFIEILTTIPFIIFFISMGTDSMVFQFFVMMDQMRLFLYQRYITWISNPIHKEETHIILNVFLLTWVMSFFIMFWENIHNY
jgi:hypothetical protein